jgi:microsomal dipeptidase-like Zn-dependent dipeptidase
MITKADELLVGAIDMHAHGYPQFSLNLPARVDDYEWAEAAQAAGMSGFVIKSHMWPTMSSAYMINKLFDGITAYGSITLNEIAGGINPAYVQIAAESGAKVVFMPTWSSVNDVSQGCHFFNRMRPYVTRIDSALNGKDGLHTLDENGNLLPEVKEVVEVCKEYNLVLASAHISIGESLKLAEQASVKGVKFVLTHPLLSPLISATHEQMKAVADTGGYIEHVFIGCMPMHNRMNPRDIYDAINYVGPEHCIMSSDAIEGWNPAPTEVLRMYISTMLALGISAEDIFTMTHTNPRKLLNL